RSVCFFSIRRRHTRSIRAWSSDVCSSDLITSTVGPAPQVVSAEDATVVLADGSSNHLADPADYAVTKDIVDEATKDTVDAPNARSEERRVGKGPNVHC